MESEPKNNEILSDLFSKDLENYTIQDVADLAKYYEIDPIQDGLKLRKKVGQYQALVSQLFDQPRQGEFASATDFFPSENSEFVLFNPSIAHYTQDYYLISYRCVAHMDPAYKYQFVHADPFAARNYPHHPWYNRWTNIKQGTRFAIYYISEHQMEYVTSLVAKDRILHLENWEDARIMQVPADNPFVLRYLITATVFGSIKYQFLELPNVNLESQISREVRRENHFRLKNLFGKLVGDPNWLCKNFQIQFPEKNWVGWLHPDNKLYFTYSIDPFHTLFQVNSPFQTNCGEMIKGLQHTMNGASPFERLRKKYTLDPSEDVVAFSSSTPAKKWKNGMYIAVGHVKIKFSDQDVSKLDKLAPSPLKTYIETYLTFTNSKYKHWRYVYYFFFYTFDPYTGNILKVSHFVDDPNPSGIIFANGLELVEKRDAIHRLHQMYLVTYGIGDVVCGLVRTSASEVANILFDANTVGIQELKVMAVPRLSDYTHGDEMVVD